MTSDQQPLKFCHVLAKIPSRELPLKGEEQHVERNQSRILDRIQQEAAQEPRAGRAEAGRHLHEVARPDRQVPRREPCPPIRARHDQGNPDQVRRFLRNRAQVVSHGRAADGQRGGFQVGFGRSVGLMEIHRTLPRKSAQFTHKPI